MKKDLIVYFSKTGNNKFVAEKLAKTLQGDIRGIKVVLKPFFLLLLFSFLKMSPSVKSISVEEYERIILLSPIWMGNVVSPIRGFLKKNSKEIKSLVYITVCGGDEEDKDGQFGYEKVFKEIKALFGKKHFSSYAISVKSLEKFEKDDVMSIRLDEKLFVGNIAKRFDEVVGDLKKKTV